MILLNCVAQPNCINSIGCFGVYDPLITFEALDIEADRRVYLRSIGTLSGQATLIFSFLPPIS